MVADRAYHGAVEDHIGRAGEDSRNKVAVAGTLVGMVWLEVVNDTAANDFWEEWEIGLADDILHSTHAGDNYDSKDPQSLDEAAVVPAADNVVVLKRGGGEEAV